MNEEINQNPTTGKDKKSMEVIFGSILVVVVILVAAYYFLGNRGNNGETPVYNESGQGEGVGTVRDEDFKTQALEKQGSTDEIADIQKDLESTDLENLTEEVDQIDAEL